MNSWAQIVLTALLTVILMRTLQGLSSPGESASVVLRRHEHEHEGHEEHEHRHRKRDSASVQQQLKCPACPACVCERCPACPVLPAVVTSPATSSGGGGGDASTSLVTTSTQSWQSTSSSSSFSSTSSPAASSGPMVPYDLSKPLEATNPGWKCVMYSVRNAPEVGPYEMCLAPQDDFVASVIRTDGHWKDCDRLLTFWKSEYAAVKTQLNTNDDSNVVFVDVGANIGACTIYLLQAGARVIAFEPVPRNMFYLVNTLRSNLNVLSRATVYQMAAGNQSSTLPIYSEHGNPGNSAVGHPTRAQGGTSTVIRIERLDDVLWPKKAQAEGKPAPIIPVMKMDIQGFELYALQGAQRLFDAHAIQSIQLEVSTDWLVNVGASPSKVCAFLLTNGFELFEENCVGAERSNFVQGRPLTLGKCVVWDRRNAECDVYARLKPEFRKKAGITV